MSIPARPFLWTWFQSYDWNVFEALIGLLSDDCAAFSLHRKIPKKLRAGGNGLPVATLRRR